MGLETQQDETRARGLIASGHTEAVLGSVTGNVIFGAPLYPADTSVRQQQPTHILAA